MSDNRIMDTITRRTWIPVSLIAILICGAVLTLWSVQQADGKKNSSAYGRPRLPAADVRSFLPTS